MFETTQLSEDDNTEPTIADIGELSLEKLLDGDDLALSRSVRRVLDELRRPGENYAAHGTTA